MWSIFDRINVDDGISEAYRIAYPGVAAEHSLFEHWNEMRERGEESVEGFMSGLKGKMAEFDAKDQLEFHGWTKVEFAPNPNQPIWDMTATSPEGQNAFWQSKGGGAERAGEIEQLVVESPDINFAVSTEIYDRIAEGSPDLVDRMVDIGSNHRLVEGIDDGLKTLSGNMGIDVPDKIVEIVPYAAAIIGAARLLHSVLRTEKQFKSVDRTEKNKVQVVQTLTLMSKMGIGFVLTKVGGAGGGLAGNVFPGPGNVVGVIGGAVAGAGMGIYLNRRLRPHMLRLALNITGLTHDDLFYFKNKQHIDGVAVRFRETASQLMR